MASPIATKFTGVLILWSENAPQRDQRVCRCPSELRVSVEDKFLGPNVGEIERLDRPSMIRLGGIPAQVKCKGRRAHQHA